MRNLRSWSGVPAAFLVAGCVTASYPDLYTPPLTTAKLAKASLYWEREHPVQEAQQQAQEAREQAQEARRQAEEARELAEEARQLTEEAQQGTQAEQAEAQQEAREAQRQALEAQQQAALAQQQAQLAQEQAEQAQHQAPGHQRSQGFGRIGSAIGLSDGRGRLSASEAATRQLEHIVDLAAGREGLTHIEQVIVAAHDSQVQYAQGYLDSAQELDGSQLPLIAAAGLAALVVQQNPQHVLDWLTGIGVGAAAYSSTRSTLLPRRMPELYILGHSALGCIRNEAPNFLGENADRVYADLRSYLATYNNTLAEARQAYQQTVLTEPRTGQIAAPMRADFQAAMTALNEAIVAANTQLNASTRQYAAFSRAGDVMGGAVADVHVRVANEARNGRISDFAALRQQFDESISAAGTPRTDQGVPESHARAFTDFSAAISEVHLTNQQKIDRIWRLSRTLSAATQGLVTATPDYMGSLDRVRACPATVH